MTKPDPLVHRRTPAHEPRAAQRYLRDPDEPEEAVLEREIQRLTRESEQALAAYKRAFDPYAPGGRTAVPHRFP